MLVSGRGARGRLSAKSSVDAQRRKGYGNRQVSLASTHSVANDEKFTHTCSERLLCRFASRAQAFVELLENGITANCDYSAHVQYRANPTATSRNHPLALPGSAFAIEWRNSDERGDLTTVELAEFGQSAQHCCSSHLPDSRHAPQPLRLV